MSVIPPQLWFKGWVPCTPMTKPCASHWMNFVLGIIFNGLQLKYGHFFNTLKILEFSCHTNIEQYNEIVLGQIFFCVLIKIWNLIWLKLGHGSVHYNSSQDLLFNSSENSSGRWSYYSEGSKTKTIYKALQSVSKISHVTS